MVSGPVRGHRKPTRIIEPKPGGEWQSRCTRIFGANGIYWRRD